MPFFVSGSAWGVMVAALVALGFLPAALRMSFEVRRACGGARGLRDRVFGHYALAGPFAWTFVWFKLRLDPMFGELPELAQGAEVRTVLDIGCGHGVAGSLLLELLGGARIVGVDPNALRVTAARRAFGGRGTAVVGGAPDYVLPDSAARFDAVLLLDVINYISDEALERTLARIHQCLTPRGRLVMRAIVPSGARPSWIWRVTSWRRGMAGTGMPRRSVDAISAAVKKAGFELTHCGMSGGNAELFWFIGAAGGASNTG